jgi:hypothetical protein
MRSGCIDPHFLDLEMSGQLHTPATLLPGKEPLVSIGDRRLGGPQSRSVRTTWGRGNS